MTKNHFCTLVLLLSLAACAPQAQFAKTSAEMTTMREEVKASSARVLELQKRVDLDLKRLDMLEANIKGTVDAQKVMADYGAKSDQLTTDIQLLQGRLEENNYRIADLSQKLDDKSYKITELSAKLSELEAKVKTLASGVSTAATGQTATAADKDKQAAPKTIDPSDAYKQAKNDYDKGNFDLALAGFQNYIAQFPDSSQEDKAQYWVGECYYSKKEFSKAIEAFAKVIKAYPKSDKVPGAKLKIGLCHLNEKNTARAKEFLNRVIKEHPGTTEAEIAKDRLQKITK